MPAGMMRCPNCASSIAQGALYCPSCNFITSPDGISHGPKTTAPGATASMVYGIVGLFICGVIFGPIAISKSNSSRALMKMDPTLEGEGMAIAGLVLGILDLVAWAIILMMRLSSMH